MLSIVELCWAVAKKRPEMEMVADLLSHAHEAAEEDAQHAAEPYTTTTRRSSRVEKKKASAPAYGNDSAPHPASARK